MRTGRPFRRRLRCGGFGCRRRKGEETEGALCLKTGLLRMVQQAGLDTEMFFDRGLEGCQEIEELTFVDFIQADLQIVDEVDYLREEARLRWVHWGRAGVHPAGGPESGCRPVFRAGAGYGGW